MRITFVHLGREHLGIEYLSSFLKKEGHTVALAYDPGLFGPEDNVFHISWLEKMFQQTRHVLTTIHASAPDLLAFTTYSGTYRWACGIAETVKQTLAVPTVFGGIHATLVPETVIANEVVDFVVVGEGFAALPELAAALSAGHSGEGIANVWCKKGPEVIRNASRPPLADLDSLPLPDKSLFEKDVNYRDDYVIITSLGCVFSCSYCCESFWNRMYNNRYFRRRGVDSVMAELAVMKQRYRFREVMFNDALFFTDKRWLQELLHRYRREIGVPFRCFGKVTQLDEQRCRLLKESGCYCIEFGMQTVNEDLKRTVLNRTETNRQAARAFQLCDRHRLRYDIDHMFGLPGETEADHVRALQYYRRLKYLNRIKCHNLTYFPKTAIIETARSRGLLTEADVAAINQGGMSDFFHQDFIQEPERKTAKDVFSKYFKLLPIIPGFLVNFSLRWRLYRVARFIPSPLIIAGQLLVAVKGRDYRFIIYLKYYPLRIRRALQNRLRAIKSWPGENA